MNMLLISELQFWNIDVFWRQVRNRRITEWYNYPDNAEKSIVKCMKSLKKPIKVVIINYYLYIS